MAEVIREKIESIECLGTFEDEYVYDIIMEDTNYPYFFANNILVHNSSFMSMEKLVYDRYKDKIPDNKTVLNFVLQFNQKMLEPALEEHFKDLAKKLNITKMTIGMEAENIADVSLITGKKKYIMNQLWKEGEFYLDHPKFKIRGIEIVRTDTPKVVREKLREIVHLIFDTKSNEKLIEFIEEYRIVFETLKFEDIATTRSAAFSNYNLNSKSLPIQVRAAFKYNEAIKALKIDKKYDKIHDGAKIKYCYINKRNIFTSNIIGCIEKMPIEILKNIEIDYETQFQKVFLAPLEKITESIGWSMKPKNSLEDLF